MLVATSSLPVPLSPSSRTVESVGATFMIRLCSPRMAMLSPIISGKKCRASMRLRTEATWSKTLVNCSILSTDQSLRDFGAGVRLKAGSLLAFSTNCSTGRRMKRTTPNPAAKARMLRQMISQNTQVAGSALFSIPYLVRR